MSAGSAQRLSRWQKAGALIPMALLVGAWGAAINNSVLANVADKDSPGVPDVPSTAFQQPSTVESQTSPGVDPRAGSKGTLSTLETNGIPAAAMSGYKRAEELLNKAVPSCNLSWTLLAGIGRVESNHGRIHGNSLTDEGTATPGIYGVPLDGSDGVAKIADTDNGKYDKDTVHDRAVGPMQFIPETWEMVAVDANNDGKKDPQNITDAATAAGIYLCSGDADVSTDAGANEAVHRYNHSDEHVKLVLSIAEKYADGKFTKTPNGQTEAMTLTSNSLDQSVSKADRQQAKKHKAAAEKKAEKKKAQEKAQKKAQQQGQQKARMNGTQESQQNDSDSQSAQTEDDSGGSSEKSGSSGPQTFGGKMQKRADNTNSKVLSGLSKAVNVPLSYAEAALRCTPKGAPWSSAYKECVRELTEG